MKERMEALRGKLIVSCQALPEEPLHSSYIMSRMAYAAYVGGASGIRANTVSDIREIKKQWIYLLSELSKKSMEKILSILLQP